MNSNFKAKTKKDKLNEANKQASRHQSTFPFGKCKVCTDQATGVHYGIPTCEGCKGFFKRSILRNEFYRCFFGNNCVLSPRTRNRCKACRFKQCIQAGMSLNGIKMGRIPKAVKEKALNNVTSDTEEFSLITNNETDFETTKEEDGCIDLNEKIEDVIVMTEQEILNSKFKTGESDELFNVIKQMSSSNTNKHHCYHNYHHVYDINHADDCLAQFLESLDMHVKSPYSSYSPQSSTESPSSFSEFLFEANSSPNDSQFSSKEQPIRATNIEIKTNFLNMYMQMTHESLEPSYKIICSLLNDKIYQLYVENMEKINLDLKSTIQMLESNDTSQFNNASIEEIWNGLIELVPSIVKLVIMFVKEMPGLNELSPKDFTTLINNRMFVLFILLHSSFFINGESYLRLANNAHYSRYWMNRVKGKKRVDIVFDLVELLNAAEMTTREKSLLIPLVITMHDENIDDLSTLHVLNEYYTRAILYEFDLNKRDNSFIIGLSKIISKMKQCKSVLK